MTTRWSMAGQRERRRPAAKRPLDVVLSSLGLLVSLPLCGLIALAVKLDDGGPVFYSQERMGREGRPFWTWKFRTMVIDADARFGWLQAKERDPRITRVGRILRAM